MKLLNDNFYTIRMSSNDLWNITYNKNLGIIYRQCIDKKWSNLFVLQKECNESFATILLPKNKLCLIYQNKDGNIVLSIYSSGQWEHKQILKWKGNKIKKAKLRALYIKNKIHIFYSLNLVSDSSEIVFYQTIDLNLNISNPISIDDTIFSSENPFDINVLDNGSLVILYEKYKNSYELGYKIFNCNNNKWSDFYTIDTNIKSHSYFSLSCNNNTIHCLYVKNSSLENILVHCSGLFLDLNYITIFKSTNNISMPCFFKFKDTIWDIWISNKTIYTCYSNDNGLNIGQIHQEKLPKSLLKSYYISFEDNYSLAFNNSLYVTPDNGLSFFPKILYNLLKNNSSYSKDSHIVSKDIKNYINNVEHKLSDYKKELSHKDKIINKLNSMLKEEKNKLSLYLTKLNNIENNYSSLKSKYDILMDEKLELETYKYRINNSKK
ncbi:hypothetical protein G8S49_00040 [Clostridium botulinum C]|uniref:Uncharacterized protein n=2 Tax=Clostridium botulinum TaxID=1491 RepID=A0A9Q4XW39_CLOBO|nr:hypothetical protein [Clostridium botulinum]MCD3193961.1 hypothetical protein [Clostridium botulinum C]MCD3199410.1 hypothetical protein [Clostridium botulinum C]MCD3204885.1 hypothetical protein [Clostridium botulinum C]MCD3207710.1 hypothetical protein [Clostridium botulinum C]MCD3224832.1 hypothetical protein [Clostridium botulinum C]